jgi:hypothetical protein
MKLLIRKIQGYIAQLFNIRYSACRRCNRPWNICKGHTTKYSDWGGCFPLCEACWSELSLVQRLPYYRDLVDFWMSKGYPDHNGQSWDDLWETLEQNVLSGK